MKIRGKTTKPYTTICKEKKSFKDYITSVYIEIKPLGSRGGAWFKTETKE